MELVTEGNHILIRLEKITGVEIQYIRETIKMRNMAQSNVYMHAKGSFNIYNKVGGGGHVCLFW